MDWESANGWKAVLRRALGRMGVHFRPGEAGSALLLFLTFFLLISFQYTTKSVRQSTFIDSLGAEKLPYVYLLIAVISYPFLRVYSRLADRLRRDSLIAATCAFFAASMLVFWRLFALPGPWVPFAFYAWISIASVMLVSQFWAFCSHVFDPRQAKRLFAFLGAGGLLGGVFGGQLARLATQYVGTRHALLVAAVVLLAVVALILLTRHVHPIDERRVAGAAGLASLDQARGGFTLLRQSRHLRLVATIMLVTVVVAQIVDLQFNWAVQEATTSLDQRTAFFGNFYSVMGITAFLFQLVFTARIHRRLGVGFAMRVLPVTMTVGTLALLAAAVGAAELLLAAALVLKIGENGVRYSLDQATRELLYVPIPSRSRVRAKAFIDVFVQRAAKGVAALLLLPVTFGLMTAPQTGFLSLALIVAWIAATVAAQQQYVESYRAGLKNRGADAVSLDLREATALDLVVQSLGSTDARRVVHALRLLRAQGRTRLVPPLLLYHDDATVRRTVLRLLARCRRRDALPLVERCLSDPDAGVRAEAVGAVAALRQTEIGSLMRPYLEASDPCLVSAAILSVWSGADEDTRQRAQRALSELMVDERSEARAEAAKALGHADLDDRGQALLLLLADHDSDVVREAIGAVRRRVRQDGRDPVFVPSLVALLDDRRLKQDARRALVAFGEPAIPELLHFMNSPDERLWVRRALPKTIAMIGGPHAVAALADSLRPATDAFLLRKLVEGLQAASPGPQQLAGRVREVSDAMAVQSARYFRALAALASLGSLGRGRLSGPALTWNAETCQPSLLEQLLAERMADSVSNLFGLMALLHDPTHVRHARHSVTSGQPGLMANAAEYLDNVLEPSVKRVVLPVVEEQPLAERLSAAKELFGITAVSRLEVLEQLVEGCLKEPIEDSGWGAAALYEVYASRTERLYPGVARVSARKVADPLVRETAEWICNRIGMAAVDPVEA